VKNQNEAELIEHCIAGDRLAWQEFIQKFSQVIIWAIKLRLKRCNLYFNQEDCEDIYQEVLIYLLKEGKLAQLKNKKGLRSWLAMVSASRTIDYLRKNRKEELLNNPEDILPEATQLTVKEATDPSLNPRQSLEFKEREQNFATYLHSLGEKEKQALKLFYLYHYKYREIAKNLGMNLNSLSMLISRARQKIKVKLKKNCEKMVF
jgi:RNA polymerase sigma factor (sigma-70 family)